MVKKRIPKTDRPPNPWPQIGYDADISGAVLIGNAERRLERFDTGWEVTFAASWGDNRAKLLFWKVYPKPPVLTVAVDLVIRRARDIGIQKIAFILFNKPEANQ